MRSDAEWMACALAMARRALGTTWPNPAVGCVLVRDGKLLGRGHTQPGGRPHAETAALEAAVLAAGSDALRGATAYVSLEPCSHHGRTPPCAEALVAAGVSRVVIALRDPDPRVNGRGVATLKRAGIAVQEGVGGEEAAAINAGFLLRVREGRPFFTLKLATSLDGKIAMANGESRWITGGDARARGHMLRATHDAILVGVATALADDPELTCRLPGLGDRSPVRIVLDSRASLPLEARLVTSARAVPTWVFVGPGAEPGKLAAYEAAGVKVVRAPIGDSGMIDLRDAARVMADLGLTRVLIEGGARVAASFVARNLVDRLELFRGGLFLGAEARSALGPLAFSSLATAPRFHRPEGMTIGSDRAEVWNVRNN